jgi:hypothetical protein
MLDMEILMKFAPASVATALASIVLPVPGGPNNRMPLHGCTIDNLQLNQYEQHCEECCCKQELPTVITAIV